MGVLDLRRHSSFNSSQVGWRLASAPPGPSGQNVSIPLRQAGDSCFSRMRPNPTSCFNSSQVGWRRNVSRIYPHPHRFQFLLGRLETWVELKESLRQTCFNSSQVGWRQEGDWIAYPLGNCVSIPLRQAGDAYRRYIHEGKKTVSIPLRQAGDRIHRHGRLQLFPVSIPLRQAGDSSFSNRAVCPFEVSIPLRQAGDLYEGLQHLKVSLFQFLLGRLETIISRICSGVTSPFQFLLGRLETQHRRTLRLSLPCFNSSQVGWRPPGH